MSLEEFFDRLSKTPRDWVVRPGGMIRNAMCQCPIEAVAGQPSGTAITCRMELQLPTSIICGADLEHTTDPDTVAMRVRIVEACAL